MTTSVEGKGDIGLRRVALTVAGLPTPSAVLTNEQRTSSPIIYHQLVLKYSLSTLR